MKDGIWVECERKEKVSDGVRMCVCVSDRGAEKELREVPCKDLRSTSSI